MKKLLLLLLIVALSAAYIDVRFAHVAYNISSVDILINGTTVATDINCDTITPYLRTEPGVFHVEIINHETKAVFFNGTLQFQDMLIYTVFAVGSDSVTPKVVEDNNQAPADQFTARIRFFQGVSDVATAEILSNGNVVATLNYADANPYIALPAGTYTIGFQVKGAAAPIFTTPFTVLGGHVYTAAFSGVATSIAFIHASDISYTYFGVRVAHLSPDAPAVDVYLRNDKTNVSSKIVPNLAFKAISGYIPFAAVTGDTYSTVVTAVNSENTLDSSTIAIAADSVLTVSLVGLVANGSPTPFHIVYLNDNNGAPADSWSNRVRFFHALPGTVAVSLSLNGQAIFTNVDFAVVTAYALVKTGTYTVALSSGEDQIATANFDFIGGGVYTIIAEGLVGTNSTQKPSLSLSTDAKFTYFTVRTANAAPGVSTATFVLRDVHGQQVFSFGAVAYGQTTAYSTLPVQGDLSLDVMSGGNSTFSQAFTFKTGDLTTLTLFGVAGKFKAVNFADTNTAPKASTVARVRFIHAVVDGPAVDVKFAGKTQFTAVAYETASGYVDVDAGTYSIVVSAAAISLLTFDYEFVGGGVYTIIAAGTAGVNTTFPITGHVSTDVAYTYFQLRFTHAASNAGNVDVILDDGFGSTTAFGNVAYQASVGYSELVLSNFTLKVTPAGNKNTVLLSVYPGFVANAFYTVTLFGLTGPNATLSSLVVKDANAAPADSHTARLRFLHAVVGAPNVDVLFNDKIVFENVAYGQLFDYQNVGAAVYRIDLYETNTNNHLQALNDYQIIGGQETTIVAMGTPGHIAIMPYNYYQYTYFQLRFIHTSPDAGTVSVLLEGETIWNDISFGTITTFKEFTSNKKHLAITSNGDPIISRDEAFTVGAGSSVIFIGTKHPNTSAPLDLIINVEKPTVPTSNAVASLRVIHTSPDSPAFDIKLNNTVQFTGVHYKQITDYKEIASGIYTLDATFNHSLAATQITLTGGFAYTVFIEGVLGNLTLDHTTDYVPPSTGYLRFFHASPETNPVDLLVNGSADYRNVAFETASAYMPYREGNHDLRIVPTDQRVPTLASGQVNIVKDTWSSVLLIGLQNKTENTTSTLETLVLDDAHELPAAGDILIRFVHASPNAPPLDIRANGVSVFSGVTYKNFTTYHTMNGNTYNVELFETGKTDLLLASKFDLSVPEKESAIYTLVAEGLYGKDLKVLAFLDNGNAPPKPPGHKSSSKSALSGVAIGLIVAGVVIVVIAAAAGGYVIWRRKRRAGYSEIATHEH